MPVVGGSKSLGRLQACGLSSKQIPKDTDTDSQVMVAMVDKSKNIPERWIPYQVPRCEHLRLVVALQTVTADELIELGAGSHNMGTYGSHNMGAGSHNMGTYGSHNMGAGSHNMGTYGTEPIT